MNVVLDKQPLKYLNSLNEPTKGRVLGALERLSLEPPQGDIKKMKGKEGYRLRVGSFRLLFGIENGSIVVSKIAPRGQAYKGD